MSRCRAFDFPMRGAQGHRAGRGTGYAGRGNGWNVGGRAWAASPTHGCREAASRRCARGLRRAAQPAIYAATDFTRCYPAAPDAHPPIPYTHAEFATHDGNPSADTLPMQETS
ncbi:Outer membrane lipoprotein [Burkholderia anthina]|nr:Outer membrane lipoprotein [Burkholderia anthina]